MLNQVKSVMSQKLCSIRLAEENDFRKLMNFVKKYKLDDCNIYPGEELIYYMNPFLNCRTYFRELVVRDNLYNYREEFILIEANDAVEGLVSLNIPQTGELTAATVSAVLVPDDLDMLKDMFEYAVEVLPLKAVTEPTKIRILYPDFSCGCISILNVMEDIGFVKEIKLRNEIGFGKDVISYVRYIPRRTD